MRQPRCLRRRSNKISRGRRCSRRGSGTRDAKWNARRWTRRPNSQVQRRSDARQSRSSARPIPALAPNGPMRTRAARAPSRRARRRTCTRDGRAPEPRPCMDRAATSRLDRAPAEPETCRRPRTRCPPTGRRGVLSRRPLAPSCEALAQPPKIRPLNLRRVEPQELGELIDEASHVYDRRQYLELLLFDRREMACRDLRVETDLLELDALRLPDFPEQEARELGVGTNLAHELVLEHRTLRHQGWSWRENRGHLRLRFGKGGQVVCSSSHCVEEGVVGFVELYAAHRQL